MRQVFLKYMPASRQKKVQRTRLPRPLSPNFCPTPAPKSSKPPKTQKTQERQERQERQRGSAPDPAGGVPRAPKKACGGNNSPRTPLFLSASCQTRRERKAQSSAQLFRNVPQRPEGSADSARAAISVQACALRPPAAGRPVLRFANAPVWLEGFPDFRGKCGGSKLWKTVAATIPRFLTHHQALDCREKAFLNARTGFCLQRITFSQRSGARGLPSGGRADGRNQPRFTRGVKCSGRRASSVPVQRVQN